MSRHTTLSLLVIILALAFLDPLMLMMPTSMVYIALGCLLLGTVAYTLLIFREKALDEREVTVRAYVDRITALVGTGALVLIIAAQALLTHHVDSAIIVVLVVMVVAKHIAYWYADRQL